MATILGEIGGKATKLYTDILGNNNVLSQLATSPVNKLWRGRILLNRTISPMPKAEDTSNLLGYRGSKYDDYNKHYAYRQSYSQAQKEGVGDNGWTRDKKRYQSQGYQGQEILVMTRKVDYTQNNIKASNEWNNQMLEANINNNNQIIIINKATSPVSKIYLQNRPDTLNIEPQSTWASISSMGRNNPFMMYTGGSDTISFEISWYASDKIYRDEVIHKCRLLEAWTKADGYTSSPPVLNIIWGGSNLFEDDNFILESAPYSLTHFQNATRSRRLSHKENGERDTSDIPSITDLKLYPNCATQTLTFRKVSSHNISHAEIYSISALLRTKGIELGDVDNPDTIQQSNNNLVTEPMDISSSLNKVII